MLNNNLVSDSNNDKIFNQISQGNNGVEIKQNRRKEEIASTIRNSYRTNGEKFEGPELEDFEKQVVFIWVEHKI